MARATWLLAALGLAAAGSIGFVGGRLTGPDASPPTPDDAPRTQHDDRDREIAGLREQVRRLTAPSARSAGDTARVPDAPVPEGPATSAGEQLRRLVKGDVPAARIADAEARARAIRSAAETAAKGADAAAAREIAEAMERERAFAEDQARGGVMNMLRELANRSVHPLDLVGSNERFAALFERRTAGPEIDGTEATLLGGAVPPPDGATVRFPAGSFAWRVSILGRNAPFPKDLLVVGAGMDATIVKLDEISADGEVASLTFRDLTIDCGDDYLTDLRSSNPATIHVERCRICGFDIGAGNSSMLDARTAAFFAEDSRIEAGWGRNPGYGNLFRVSSGLVRLDRCTVVGPFSSVYEASARTTYLFRSCRFVGATGSRPFPIDAAPEGVRFEDCTVEDADPAASAADRIRALTSVAAAAHDPSLVRELIAKHRIDAGALARDGTAFAALFPDRTDAVRIDGAAGRLTSPAPKAAAVVFGSGVYDWNGSDRLGDFRGDLTIVGAGMDTTLLRISIPAGCASVTVRDATIDAGRGGLEMRSGGALRLERCRVIAFDRSAGGDSAIEAWSAFVLARTCRFETGYGSNAPRGGLFGSSPCAARLEDCDIVLPAGEIGRGGSIVLSRCRVLLAAARRASIDAGKSGLLLDATTFTYADATGKGEGPRPFSDINPFWGKGNAR